MYSIGAEIIGKTYRDYVSFSITVVPKYFDTAMSLISKCLNQFTWTSESVNLEKKIVCKQIQNSTVSFQQWIDSSYFKDSSYGFPIMGTIDNIELISVDDLNRWKTKYFCCKNACMVITGDYSELEMENCIRKLPQNNIGEKSRKTNYIPDDFYNRKYDNRFDIFYDDSDITEITVNIDINNDFQFESLRLLSSILGEGCTSKLPTILREERNYTDDVYTDFMCFDGFYRLTISFNVSSDDFKKSMACFFDVLGEMRKCISQNDINSSIRFFTDNQFMDLDNPRLLNERYLLCDFVLPHINSEPHILCEEYKKISCNDILNCSRNIFKKNNFSFVISTNLNDYEVRKYLESLLSNFT